MPVLCLSITYRTAPVAVRERLALSAGALDRPLVRGEATLPLEEAVILSTCNRLEIYAVAPAGSEAAFEPVVVSLLAESLTMEPAEFEPHLVRYIGPQVAEHLCRVAAGLDSMVLGESEILGQVADAYEIARTLGRTGPVTSELFRAAIRAGKRARSETAIGRNPMSVSSVAVDLAAQVTGSLENRCVAVVGAGRMARKAVTALRAHGATTLLVVNRSRDGGAELAREWGGEALGFDRLGEGLARADIVIASTSAPHPVVEAGTVRTAMAGRDRPLVFIDIALPRDVDPEVRRIPGVHLFDLDDLQQRLDRSANQRRREVPRAEAIAMEEARRFDQWLEGGDLLPVVAELRRQAEAVRQVELARLVRNLPPDDGELHRRLEHFSRALVNKLLHEPTQRLREQSANGHAAEYARLARELFGLEPGAE